MVEDAGVHTHLCIYGRGAAAYTLLSSLGRGRLTEAYRAISDTGSPVVLTFFRQQEGLDAERFAERFFAEAHRLITLSHPHILQVLDFGEHAGMCFLVTQDSMGETLASLLRHQKHYGFQEAAVLLEQISAALHTAHNQGILHQNLSPRIVLVENGMQVRVAGFGLHTLLRGADVRSLTAPFAQIVSIAGTYLGNPAYIAPECVYGESTSSRSDLYALAILLFELLAGCPPFEGNHFLSVCLAPLSRTLPPLTAFRPDAPAALDQFFRQATSWRPEERFADASDLLTAYLSALRSNDSQSEFTNVFDPITSPEGEVGKEKQVDSLVKQGEISSARLVSLSNLSPAPWIQEEPAVSKASVRNKKLLQFQDGSQVSYYAATPPSFGDREWSHDAISDETGIAGQNKRIRLTVSIEATVEAFRSLFSSSSSSTWQDLTRVQCFPVRAEDFPAIPRAFAARTETFSSSRSPIVVESEPVDEAHPPRPYQHPVTRS